MGARFTFILSVGCPSTMFGNPRQFHIDRIDIEPIAKKLPPPMFTLPPVMSPPPLVGRMGQPFIHFGAAPMQPQEPTHFLASPPPMSPPPMMMSPPPPMMSPPLPMMSPPPPMMSPPPPMMVPPLVGPMFAGPPPPTVPVDPFTPASEFQGAKSGYFFSTGAQGVGYYQDSYRGPGFIPGPGAGPPMPPHVAEVSAFVSRSPSAVSVGPFSPLPVDPIAEAEAAIRDCDNMFKRFTAVDQRSQMSQLHVDAYHNMHQHDLMQMRHNAHETYALRHPGHSAGGHPEQYSTGLDYMYGESMGLDRSQSRLSPAKSSAYLRAQAAIQFLK